jgi:acid phosphatase (class A)
MKKILICLILTLGLLVGPAQADGFLPDGDIPNTINFLPAPPQEGGVDFLRDIAKFWETRSFQGTARWKQAAFDADITNHFNQFFSEAIGLTITKKDTPIIYALITKMEDDLGDSARLAKEKYKRTRPFIYFKIASGTTCFPKDEPFLKNNGSYPSGHSTYGWGMALVLAEIFPDRADAIFARASDYAFSRVICGVHWQSDIEAGLTVASAVVIKLHDNAEFAETLAKAKQEAVLAVSRQAK